MLRGAPLLILCFSAIVFGCKAPSATRAGAVPRTEGESGSFHVLFETTKGPFVVEVDGSWAPLGAARFRELVEGRFYDGCMFFRVIPGWVAQFGINGDPDVSARWKNAVLRDDPVVGSNVRGTIAFATDGPDTRTTQVYINFADNSRLDSRGFSPFGKIVEGMDVVDLLYAEYGEGPPRGKGPDQELIETQGNAYLFKNFPKLDYVIRASFFEL